MSTLGARFASIQSSKGGAGAGGSGAKSQFQVNKAARVANAVGQQKGKRGDKLAQARGQPVNNNNKGKNNNASGKGKQAAGQ
jgi:hypothetical protein